MEPPCSNLRRDPVKGVRVWANSPRFALIEGINGSTIFGSQFEIKNVEVLFYPFAMHRFREDDMIMVDVPPQDSLGVGFSVSRGNAVNDRVLYDLALTK